MNLTLADGQTVTIQCGETAATITLTLATTPPPVPVPIPIPVQPPVIDPSTFPLVQAANLVKLGSFRLPQDPVNGTGFDYGGAAISFDPIRKALVIGGHDAFQQKVAEVTIPAVSLTTVPIATFLQPFTDLADGRTPLSVTSDPNGTRIGGTLVTPDGRIFVSYFAVYGSTRASHFIANADFAGPRNLLGPFAVGTVGPDFASAYMGLIPAVWQPLLGGSALVGNGCRSIISRTSYGPCVQAWTPPASAPVGSIPATPLVYYPGANPLAQWDATSPLFNGATHIEGVIFPENTRSVLFFGRQGTGTWCYGGTTGDGSGQCVDPEDSSKGTHAYPYRYQVWAYDALDLLAVKMGKVKPWAVQPYAVWPLALGGPVKQTDLRGAAYDPATGRIFLSKAFGDGDRPTIEVFTVSL